MTRRRWKRKTTAQRSKDHEQAVKYLRWAEHRIWEAQGNAMAGARLCALVYGFAGPVRRLRALAARLEAESEEIGHRIRVGGTFGLLGIER